MTGYGRGQSACNGTKICVELNSVNRKQSEVMINLPRELTVLEAQVRDAVNARVSRGRMNVTITLEATGTSARTMLDAALARQYYKAMLDLQKELKTGGEISIETILRAPGVMKVAEEQISPKEAWDHIAKALGEALDDLIKMREKEGKHLAKDLIKRLKLVRQSLRKIRLAQPVVIRKYRQALLERIQKAGIEVPIDDDRLAKELVIFADKSDVSEELTRLESHLAQFAHHLRKIEPVGRTLDFMIQEIYREFNTLGSKANDVEISQLVVTCKAEMEKIREQIQNIE